MEFCRVVEFLVSMFGFVLLSKYFVKKIWHIWLFWCFNREIDRFLLVNFINRMWSFVVKKLKT